MAAINKDIVLVVSLVLSVVSLVLLFGVTWYFHSSLDLLQQQVEYDRELLYKLQEHFSDNGNDNTINKHDVVKRQSQQTCQCKDGIPGPQGPPGNKGEIGNKGDAGPSGPRGNLGYPGPQGLKGEIGQRGHKGNTGDPGDRGPRGLIGDPGLQGNRGQKGDKGDTGDSGNRGPRGLVGDTGLRGPVGEAGTKGAKGDQGSPGTKGEKGGSGSPGCNPTEAPGQIDTKPDMEKRNGGGAVYVRWGHDQCPSTAQLVYSGRAGGSHWSHPGGGSNPQCLPLDPNFLTPISGAQYRAYVYGAEYQTDTNSNSHIHGRHNTDVPCAVCHVSNRTAVYMVPAKYTCPTGWTAEYYGYLMSSYYGSGRHRTQFTCIDTALKPVAGSSADHDGLLFHFVEGRCGSLPCPPYDNTRELSCAICTK